MKHLRFFAGIVVPCSFGALAPAAHGALTLRYNFETVTSTTVPNVAPDSPHPAGETFNSDQTSLTSSVVINVNGVARQLGTVMNFAPAGGDATGDANVGHVNTGVSAQTLLITPTTSHTAMAWANFGSTTGDNMIFGQTAGDGRLHHGSRNGNFHSGFWGDDIGPDQGFNFPTGTNVWHHVAYVNNGQHQSVYVDGVLKFEGADAAGSMSLIENVVIGSSGNNGSFVGSVDEVRVYDTALTQAEIQAAMQDLPEVLALVLETASISLTGGQFVIKDTTIVGQGTATLNPAGAYSLSINDTPIPGAALSLNKVGNTTTIGVAVPPDPNTVYTYSLVVPLIEGGTQTFTGTVRSPYIPAAFPGLAGSPGVWAMREIRAAADPNLGGAITFARKDAATLTTEGTVFVDANPPVINHRDPDTNGPTTSGNFNNDFPYLTDTPGIDDNFIVVVAHTQVVVPAAGTYTFSVHSDDGFAMRVKGPGGGRFISHTGAGEIDASDNTTLAHPLPTGDSNTRGVYQFDAAGTYDIQYIAYENGGGGFCELAWAQGSWADDRDAVWSLVGNSSHPSIPATSPRWPVNLPGPQGTNGFWGMRTYNNAFINGDANTPDNLGQAMTFLSAVPQDRVESDTKDTLEPVLNHRDPNTNGDSGLVGGDLIYPNDTGADDNRVITVAKGRIRVETAGTYTFNFHGDDGMFIRFKSPLAKIQRVTGLGRYEMSNPNEAFFEAGTGDVDTRVIINLPAGEIDVEYVMWEGGGGFWYEVSVAPGAFLNNGDTTLWRLVGVTSTATAINFPSMADPGWNVQTSPVNSVGLTGSFSIAGALAALTEAGTVSTVHDSLNFTDPQSGGGPGYTGGDIPFLNDTGGDDNNYAMRARGQMVITVPGTYALGFRGDDGGYLVLRGAGATPTPSFTSIIQRNHVESVIEEDVFGSGTNNKVRTEVGTGDSLTVALVPLVAGTYDIETLMYEGGGGSWWEVFGGQYAGFPYAYPLLKRGGQAPAPNWPGIPLVGLPAPLVTDFVRLPDNAFRITFNSVPGATYTLSQSTDLDPSNSWVDIVDDIVSGGTSTTFTGVVSLDSSFFYYDSLKPRNFFRIRQN